MANTPNYNLKKVEYTEIADIPGHFNANFDTIDTVMKNNADAAVAAEDNAKSYASGLIGTLSNLLTTAKNNIVVAVNEIFGKVEDVEADLLAHKAEDVTQVDGVHGFIYEEGNWTPAFGTAFDGVYGTQTGKYVRKGNEVTLYFILEATEFSYSDNSQINILGLPFNVDPDYPTVANIAWYNSVATSKISFESVNPYPVLYGFKYESSRATLRPADIGTNFYIKGTISFRILT